MQKTAGIILIVGSVLFLIAAFTPITYKVIIATDPQQRAAVIESDRIGWLVINILFATGSVITVIGLGLFVQVVQGLAHDSTVNWLSYLSLAMFALGTLFWVMISYYRVASPPQALASNLAANQWIFPAYTILLQIALMVVGVVLLRSAYPVWLGWGMLVLAAMSLAAYLIFKDMPPFAHYVLLLVMGAALLR